MKHLILDLRQCDNTEALKRLCCVEAGVNEILETLEVTIVKQAGHQFLPHGATVIYLLAESHCSCHTFWEEKRAYVDLFCCTDFDEERATELFRECFKSHDVQPTILIRK